LRGGGGAAGYFSFFSSCNNCTKFSSVFVIGAYKENIKLACAPDLQNAAYLDISALEPTNVHESYQDISA
jgi:hypothetical protein